MKNKKTNSELKADRLCLDDYSTHRQTPWTDNKEQTNERTHGQTYGLSRLVTHTDVHSLCPYFLIPWCTNAPEEVQTD